ncbi:unnamed protein product [Sphagnum jensenii]|uniref:Uncharacterized protein n=1 Tax=Sphagnum jensenii TaxID=128206 RepID=A0ABP0VV28_9BRYO
MGSLMSGWDSQPLDDQKLMERTNSSLTKNEISAFWLLRRRAMPEEHLKEATALKATKIQTHAVHIDASSAIPVLEKRKQEAADEFQQPTASNPNWWTRSKWAFLNFPPEMLLSNC